MAFKVATDEEVNYARAFMFQHIGQLFEELTKMVKLFHPAIKAAAAKAEHDGR